MPNISDYKINRIKELGTAGLTPKVISKEVGISLPTAMKYLKTATKSKKTVVGSADKDMVFSYALGEVEKNANKVLPFGKPSWDRVVTAQDLQDAIALVRRYGFKIFVTDSNGSI